MWAVFVYKCALWGCGRRLAGRGRRKRCCILALGSVVAAERLASEEHFRAGYQEAATEAVRFLVEVHGYGAGDGLCAQLASHLQRHCEAVTKGEKCLMQF